MFELRAEAEANAAKEKGDRVPKPEIADSKLEPEMVESEPVPSTLAGHTVMTPANLGQIPGHIEIDWKIARILDITVLRQFGETIFLQRNSSTTLSSLL